MPERRRGIARRSLLAGIAAAVAAPAVIRAEALASSGEVNFMGWSAYDHDRLFKAFTRKTGIRINFLEQPDQDAMLAQARISVPKGDVDFAEPTMDRIIDWVSADLLQPWDEGRLPLDAYEPAFLSARDAGLGPRYFLPTVWGAEALTYASEAVTPAYGEIGMADLFTPAYAGKTTVRARTGLVAVGRLLEAQGKLPGPWRDSYRDEETMRKYWDLALEEAIRQKGAVKRFWSAEPQARAAFVEEGCTLGLTWDSTAFNLFRERKPFGFIAPKEGALGWMQGYLLARGGRNTDAAYEFIRFVSTPEGAALNAGIFSANPVVRGAVDHLGDKEAAFLKAAYPQDALSRIWWFPAEPAWFVPLRNEYAARWEAA